MAHVAPLPGFPDSRARPPMPGVVTPPQARAAAALAILRETFGFPAFRGAQAEIVDQSRAAATRSC